MTKNYYVYILASKRNGTLYTGFTSNLIRRVWEHKEHLVPGFTKQYGVDRLVWFEQYADVGEALAREHRIKRWHRKWKLQLIEAENPDWQDLYADIIR